MIIPTGASTCDPSGWPPPLAWWARARYRRCHQISLRQPKTKRRAGWGQRPKAERRAMGSSSRARHTGVLHRVLGVVHRVVGVVHRVLGVLHRIVGVSVSGLGKGKQKDAGGQQKWDKPKGAAHTGTSHSQMQAPPCCERAWAPTILGILPSKPLPLGC